MTAITTQTMSFTEQRAIERQKKKDAQAKRQEQLIAAQTQGRVAETAFGSRLIDAGLIKLISQYMGKNGFYMTCSGSQAKNFSCDIKDQLQDLFVDVSEGKVEGGVYPLAAAIVNRSLASLLNIVGNQSGESVTTADGADLYENQTAQKVIDAFAAAAQYELQMVQLLLNNPDQYYACKRIVNEPAFAASMEHMVLSNVLKGWTVDEVLAAYAEWKEQGNTAKSFSLDVKGDAFNVHQWSADELKSVGGFVNTCIDKASLGHDGKFWTVVLHKDEAGMKSNYFVLADSDILDKLRDEEINSVRDKGVMHMPPVDWSHQQNGGQADNMTTGADPFIRKGQPDASANAEVYAAVNKLQSVPFLINTFVFDAAMAVTDQLVKGAHKIGSFTAPIKGVHVTKSLRTRNALKAAQAEVEYGGPFWSYWNVDYRGRMYPINSVLHVQGTDFEKSLLKIADAQPVNDRTEFWLSVHLANTFGFDKVTQEAQVEWVKENLQDIISVAQQPVEWLKYWANPGDDVSFVPDKPWQFMAACEEYVALFVDGTRDTTALLTATDCTCSGIQVLSGITKDESAAAMVNVLFSELPQDAYGDVAAIAQKVLLGEQACQVGNKVFTCDAFADYAHILDRTVCKKVVMTMPYNSSASSHTGYIKAALKGKVLPEDQDQKRALIKLVGQAIRFAMSTLLPHIMQFKQWLNQAAGGYAEAHPQISWVTPSGFKVVQVKNVLDVVTLRTSFGGKRGEVEMCIGTTDEVASNKHGTCTMPNFVHSLDASILHKAFAHFSKPFALIHDSVMTTASDMDDAIAAYKQSYIEHFADGGVFEMVVSLFKDYYASPLDILDRISAEMVMGNPIDEETAKALINEENAPVAGALNVEEVRDSLYLLS